jgi:hypothetical protein
MEESRMRTTIRSVRLSVACAVAMVTLVTVSRAHRYAPWLAEVEPCTTTVPVLTLTVMFGVACAVTSRSVPEPDRRTPVRTPRLVPAPANAGTMPARRISCPL